MASLVRLDALQGGFRVSVLKQEARSKGPCVERMMVLAVSRGGVFDRLQGTFGFAEPLLSDCDLSKCPVRIRHRELKPELFRSPEEFAQPTPRQVVLGTLRESGGDYIGQVRAHPWILDLR